MGSPDSMYYSDSKLNLLYNGGRFSVGDISDNIAGVVHYLIVT